MLSRCTYIHRFIDVVFVTLILHTAGSLLKPLISQHDNQVLLYISRAKVKNSLLGICYFRFEQKTKGFVVFEKMKKERKKGKEKEGTVVH